MFHRCAEILPVLAALPGVVLFNRPRLGPKPGHGTRGIGGHGAQARRDDPERAVDRKRSSNPAAIDAAGIESPATSWRWVPKHDLGRGAERRQLLHHNHPHPSADLRQARNSEPSVACCPTVLETNPYHSTRSSPTPEDRGAEGSAGRLVRRNAIGGAILIQPRGSFPITSHFSVAGGSRGQTAVQEGRRWPSSAA